ncbi:MAG: AzlC family ABC transporter permease [Clostridia bacterium]|nr:AzlC family ABC transporter permease [Clostridia bacterium]
MSKQIIRRAFLDTLPVMSGYLVLGFGFGILMKAAGFGILLTLVMSLFVYAGSMQYAAVGLLTGGASLMTVGLTTLMVNARHLFYGISMLDKYRRVGARKAYLIFGLTDETYSLVCQKTPDDHFGAYSTWVTLFDHAYWVAGSVLGAVVGTLVRFNSDGIEFALTALFLTVFLEQWMTAKRHAPALIGVGASALCLAIFGAESFLIPSMLIIALLLSVYKEGD